MTRVLFTSSDSSLYIYYTHIGVAGLLHRNPSPRAATTTSPKTIYIYIRGEILFYYYLYNIQAQKTCAERLWETDAGKE
jgi:hypothetical protein